MSEVFSFKPIKAKKLNVEAFRRAALNAVEAEAKIHQAKLRPTVRGWTGARPRFESLTSIRGGDLIAVTGPVGDTMGVQKWVWTDLGTRPHRIRAKNAPTLRFQINFIPSTRPGSFESGRAASWPPWRAPKEVWHPGTEPRRWTETLTKERKRKFSALVFRNFDRAAKRAF